MQTKREEQRGKNNVPRVCIPSRLYAIPLLLPCVCVSVCLCSGTFLALSHSLPPSSLSLPSPVLWLLCLPFTPLPVCRYFCPFYASRLCTVLCSHYFYSATCLASSVFVIIDCDHFYSISFSFHCNYPLFCLMHFFSCISLLMLLMLWLRFLK